MRLLASLLRRYRPYKTLARPLMNATDTLLITLEVILIQILDFDEKNQMLTTLVWKRYNWQDDMMIWDPAYYGGIKDVQIPADKIWTPDIILYNNVGSSDVEQHKSLVVINYRGQVLWMPPVKYQSSCTVDMTDFPFDQQRCELRFGSWAYDVKKLDLKFMNNLEAFNLEEYVPNSEWEIADNKAVRREKKYPCCAEPFVDVTYTLSLQRQVTFHMRLILVPTILLSYMTLAVFWIPPFRADRTAMGMSLFSSFLLLLILVVDSSPPTAAAKLSQYYIVVIFLVALGIVLSLCTINMCDCHREFPHCLYMVLLRLRCCKGPVTERPKPPINKSLTTQPTLPQPLLLSDMPLIPPRPIPTAVDIVPPDPTNNEKWRTLALLLDRVYFCLFLIAIIVTFVCVMPERLFMWS